MMLAVASTVLSAFGTVMAARERAAAQQFESEQKKRESEMYRIAGAQAETDRREHLTSSLETIMTIRAGRGVGQGSPTARAAYNEIIEDESQDIRVERLNYLSRAEESMLASRMLRRQARGTMLSGYVGALADITGGGARMYGMSKKA
jgi:hypothetical protein